jgi:hypothetical protein
MQRTIERNCEFCQKSFQASVKELNRGNARFCSRTCSSSRKHPKSPNVACAWCKKSFYRSQSHIALPKTGLQFCCRACKDSAQRMDGLKELHLPHYGKGDHANYREFTLKNLPNACNRCGYDKYVVVHHKDRNRSNNSIENLEVLCPNCHALEHWAKS